LASLDVSGQWPVFHADASPNEVSIYINTYTSAKSQSQEAVFKDLAASHFFHAPGSVIYGVLIPPARPIYKREILLQSNPKTDNYTFQAQKHF